MSEKRCHCCDLPVSWCGRQAEQKQRAAHRDELAALRAEPGVIESKWTTRCPVCNGRVCPGQLIRPADNPALSWQHAWTGDCA